MKIKYQDREVEATELQILSEHQPWSEYTLGDGRILRIKNVLSGVWEIPEVKGKDGKPVIHTQWKPVIDVREAK